MKSLLHLAVIVCASFCAKAQTADPETFARLLTEPSLKKNLTLLASDSMMGRETGTAGQRMAAEFIEKQFIRAGLRPANGQGGFQQSYPLLRDTALRLALVLNQEKKIRGTDYLVVLRQQPGGGFRSDSVVFVGYGSENDRYSDYRETDVAGKVVCFILAEPRTRGRDSLAPAPTARLADKLARAAEKGAIGALVIDPRQESFNASTLNRSLRNGLYYPPEPTGQPGLPHVYLSHGTARSLLGTSFDNLLSLSRRGLFLNEIKMRLYFPVTFELDKRTDTVFATNVMGLLEGKEKKKEYLFLTAHYDHLGVKDGQVYNGADDDGSGTVALIQMATAFCEAAKKGFRPKRTIVFLAFSGEEKGLWGSQYYSEHPVFPPDATIADLNTDMIGRIDTERQKADTLNYVYVVGHDKISSELKPLIETVNQRSTRMTLDYKFDDPADPHRIYYRSDHYHFARLGIPVLFFYDGMLKGDYHQPTDDVDKIQWMLYGKRMRLIFLTAWELAVREQMLKRDRPLPPGER